MLIVPSAYLAPISYNALLYAAREAVEDRHEHFVKQTYRNRCCIATPGGVQALTIPVVRDNAGHTAMKDIRISDHGNWRHLHWQALVSAYDNSPYFMYYADDFRPLYEQKFTYLVDFNAALQHTVLSLLSLDLPIRQAEAYVSPTTACVCDLRPLLSPKVGPEADTAAFSPRAYYQVFAERTGFLPNLSIVDLLFNMGPE
ncbi:MAG: WbqC family protein, partial [Rothia sp. (in: high G+C Gram-positive bacteria)]|uniref:WbqC family protein n=1 Tax=Rothia sp. (in: high G+C Gram-positive bacteria) TaxID=1885016 RepID=UPI0026E080E8